MTNKVTILDYGMCNLLNVARAFEHVGADVVTTADAATALKAERLVVPGVGAYKESIEEIRSRGLDDVIHSFIAGARPFLGICVGMQMLFEASEEFGEHKGLGILPGRVQAVPNRTVDGFMQRVPHIGWNHLLPPRHGRNWKGTLLSNFDGAPRSLYFVHSFAAMPTEESDRLSDCEYGGHRICAAVQRENVMATQFHPERSAEAGLAILRGFVAL